MARIYPNSFNNHHPIQSINYHLNDRQSHYDQQLIHDQKLSHDKPNHHQSNNQQSRNKQCKKLATTAITKNITDTVSDVNNQQIPYYPQTVSVCLFIDTALFPTHNPVRTLGVMEKERWLQLSDNLVAQEQSERHQLIKEIIISHYLDNPRGLPLWGDIQRYCYCHFFSNGHIEKVWFDVTGQVLELGFNNEV